MKLEDYINRIPNKKDVKQKEKLQALWKKYFYQYLREEGYNMVAIKQLFNWNQDFWECGLTEDFENEEELLNCFSNKFAYICDRCTFERLLCAHYYYNALIEEFLK